MKYEKNIELLRAGELWKNTRMFKAKREKAITVCIKAFETNIPAYLAISGGKDSVAMSGIVDEAARRCGQDFVLWGHLSDASFPGTEETILETANRLGRDVVIDRSPVSAFDVVGQQSRAAFGKKGYFFDAIKAWVEKSNRRLTFVGVRADESKRRRNACRAQGQIFQSNTPCHHTKCFPVAWFTLNDVAAALSQYNLPVHPIYNKLPIDQKTIRLGYVTALDLMHQGTIVFLRLNYPALYNKLLQAFPEASQYA